MGPAAALPPTGVGGAVAYPSAAGCGGGGSRQRLGAAEPTRRRGAGKSGDGGHVCFVCVELESSRRNAVGNTRQPHTNTRDSEIDNDENVSMLWLDPWIVEPFQNFVFHLTGPKMNELYESLVQRNSHLRGISYKINK